MQTARNRLTDIRRRIADSEGRLGELEDCATDRGVTAVLIDSATTTLELLREHERRLESRLAPAKATGDSR